jgi:phosphonopyruvate decarboxylase
MRPIPKLEAAQVVIEELTDHLFVVCNGMIGREVHAVTGPRPDVFTMIGSMGVAAPIALGLARCAPARRVACIEGDGNVLMGLGSLAQIGAAQPERLIHVCLDNGVHASTGGQQTISTSVRLEEIARAAGYVRAERVRTADELRGVLRALREVSGPRFVLAEVEAGITPGIPRVEIAPPEIALRFREAARPRPRDRAQEPEAA